MSENPERKLIIEGDWKSQVQAEREQSGRAAGDAGRAELHVDSDWKAEAQREKERLAEAERQRSEQHDDRGRGLPEASFRTLMSVLASQAIMGLGTMADPQTGHVIVDLESARLGIDLLQVLEEKSKGNLEKDEVSELGRLLTELRSRYVQMTHLVAEHKARGADAAKGPPSAG